MVKENKKTAAINPIKMIGNIEPGLTRTMKSWIIGCKTVNRRQAQQMGTESIYRVNLEGNMFMGQWNEYLEVLASKAPTPGGGSAAAVYGAIGTALGEMVGNLTAGKKKFAIYEEDVQRILVRLREARMDFIRLEKADEQAFEPLSEVYRMKAETEEEKKRKDERMEECLKAAAKVPMEVMERAVSVMDDIEFLALHGSRLAVSDAGVGIQGIRSALLGAVMSVYINTKMMKDREYAETVNSQAELLIKKGTEQADRIYEIVLKAVRG